MTPDEVPAALAGLGAEALRQAAHECDGDCGLPEDECWARHPVNWSAKVAGDTHVHGSAEALARIVIAAVRSKTPKPPPAPPTVGEAVARTLRSLGMTQVALARITGLTAKHVNQVITGKVGLSPDVAVKFAHATGTPAAVWLGIQGARAEWESRALDDEPACSECGGRPRRGLIRSEDGETWQCEGCYRDLGRAL